MVDVEKVKLRLKENLERKERKLWESFSREPVEGGRGVKYNLPPFSAKMTEENIKISRKRECWRCMYAGRVRGCESPDLIPKLASLPALAAV
jgi:hypothetical protein